MAWRDWVRTVEIEPSLYAADFARLGEQIESLLDAGVRVFHFDVGDGHFVPPVTIGPDRAAVDRAADPRAGGAIDCHLMVDNPAHHFAEIAAVGRRQRHLPRRGRGRRRARSLAAAREHGLGVGVAFNPDDAGRGRRRGRGPRRRPRASA